MQITDIKVRKLFNEGPMKAIVSVTFDGQLAVHDIKVIYARDKFFIVMPSRKNPDETYRDIDSFAPGMSRKQKIYWRRQALLTDLFLTGSNALTQKGQLVNLDMIGNRVGGITFGPKHVVLFIGINKITANLEEAMHRVRTIAAPRNAIRHEGFRTPCHKTGVCMDCNSPDRICNVWTITEKSYPAGRIKVILIGEELGL